MEIMSKVTRYVRGYLPDVDLVIVENFNGDPIEVTIKAYVKGLKNPIRDVMGRIEDLEVSEEDLYFSSPREV